MHIDSYQFGKIVVDGVTYNSDCLIVGDGVQSNWWRKEGHLLSIDDVQEIFTAKPVVLIIGCGTSGIMKVPDATRQTLGERGIRVEALKTAQAVERFNELSEASENVAAAFHLTC